MSPSPDFYRRYIACCNARRFDELGEFVADRVEVNGERSDVAQYAAGLRQVIEAAPDFHWEVEQVLVDGEWLAVRLTDTGTAAGRAFTLREFAMYHVVDGRIVAVWGDLDHTRLSGTV